MYKRFARMLVEPNRFEVGMSSEAVRITTARIGDLLPDEFLALDVTRKSGMLTLAPPWGMVRDYKSGRLPWDQYEPMYRKLMLRSQSKHPDVWESLVDAGLSGKILCFLCYCRRGDHCHRLILATMVKDYVEKAGHQARVIPE